MRRLKNSRLWGTLSKPRAADSKVTRHSQKDEGGDVVPQGPTAQPERRLNPKQREETEKENKQSISQRPPCLETHTTPKPPTLGTGILPTELLQQIFSHLDFLSLTRCRFVCPFFRACLRSDFTTPYQRFLSTSLPPCALTATIAFTINMARSPVSTDGTTIDTYTAKFGYQITEDSNTGSRAVSLTSHPVLLGLESALTLRHRRDGTTQMSGSLVRAVDDAEYNKEWGRMLAFVPPIQAVMVMCLFSGQYRTSLPGKQPMWPQDSGRRARVVWSEGNRGVLLVDVLRALEDMMGKVMRGTQDFVTHREMVERRVWEDSEFYTPDL